MSKQKTYVGRMLYYRPGRGKYGLYVCRDDACLACEDGVSELFIELGIPTPVKKFRVHATPHPDGEFMVDACGWATSNDFFVEIDVPIRRLGFLHAEPDGRRSIYPSRLAKPGLPRGTYEVEIEYWE